MLRKILDTVAVLALIGVLLLAWEAGGTPLLGGTSHTASQFDAAGGFAVNGTAVITSALGGVFTSLTNSGSEAIGGGTPIVKIQCASTTQNIASTIENATTTFDIALAGVSTSSNQAFWIGNATTTAGSKMLAYTVNPTSTAGFATVTLRPLGGTYVGQSVFSVCYAQFN